MQWNHQKKFLLTYLFAILLLGQNCSSPPKESNQSDNNNLILEETINKAFDALNQLQVQSNGHLYSTFPGIKQPCCEPDTVFYISNVELESAIHQIISQYSTDLSDREIRELAMKGASSQNQYLVHQCSGSDFNKVRDSFIVVPTRGTWVLPEVQGKRDILLDWQ